MRVLFIRFPIQNIYGSRLALNIQNVSIAILRWHMTKDFCHTNAHVLILCGLCEKNLYYDACQVEFGLKLLPCTKLASLRVILNSLSSNLNARISATIAFQAQKLGSWSG